MRRHFSIKMFIVMVIYHISTMSLAVITRKKYPGNLQRFMVYKSYDPTGSEYGSYASEQKFHSGSGIVSSSGLTETTITLKNNHQYSGSPISSNIYKSNHSPPIKVSTPTSIVSVVSKQPLKVTSDQWNNHKDPDDIQSAQLTVLDPSPSNSNSIASFGGSRSSISSFSYGELNQRRQPVETTVHDKLIVAYKPGRPLPPPSPYSAPFPSYSPLSSSSSVGNVFSANPIKDNPYITRKSYNFTGGADGIIPSDSEEYNTSSEYEGSDTVSTYIPNTSYHPNRVNSQWPAYGTNILNDFNYAADTVTFVTTTPSTTRTQSSTPSTVSYPSVSTQFNSGGEVISIITKKPYSPATVNANLAPSRSISTPAPSGNTGIFSSILSLAGVSGPGGMMNRLTPINTGNEYGSYTSGQMLHSSSGIITSSGLIKTTNDKNTHKNHQHFGSSISSNIYNSPHSQPMKVSTPTSIVSVMSKPQLKVTSVQGNNYKDPDHIQSAPLTVFDPSPSNSNSIVSNGGSSSSVSSFPFGGLNQRLRPIVTIVHDKLIVAYKPGRPLPPSFPSAAPFPSSSPSSSSSSVSSVGNVFPVNPIKDNPYTTRKPYNFTGAMDWIIPSESEVFNTTSEPDTVSTYFPITSYPPNRVTSQWPTYDPNILNDFTSTTPATADTQPVTITYVTTTPSTTTKQSTTPSTVSYPSVSTQSNSGGEVIAIVTKKPYFPSATVNAILAPPMPSRPISTPAPLGNTGIFSNLLSLAGVSGPGGIMNRLTLLKTALFTLLVMFLPPLTLAAAVAQLL